MTNPIPTRDFTFKATYQGRVIGWFETADEAQAAIDACRKADAARAYPRGHLSTDRQSVKARR